MRTAAVSSTIEKSFAPEKIIVSVNVRTTDEDRHRAIEKSNAAVKTVHEKLQEQGFGSHCLKDSRFAVRPNTETLYEKSGDYYYRAKEEVIGYECCTRKTMEVGIQPDTLTKIWEALTSCGDEVTYSISYALNDEKAAEKALLKDAVIDAKNRAEAMALADGCVLGKLMVVRNRGTRGFTRNYESCDIRGFAASAPIFNPDSIEVECEVHAEWELLEG